MKTIDLQAFRKANNLTQTELGEYLGVQKAFISAVENGRSKLPKQKFTLLLQNKKGWDVSMLSQQEMPRLSPRALAAMGDPVAEDALIAELRAQVEKLEAKIDQLNQALGEKNALIKMMRQGDVESV